MWRVIVRYFSENTCLSSLKTSRKNTNLVKRQEHYFLLGSFLRFISFIVYKLFIFDYGFNTLYCFKLSYYKMSSVFSNDINNISVPKTVFDRTVTMRIFSHVYVYNR